MKAVVTYYSETGNTEKLARAIYDAIEHPGKEILPVEEVKSFEEYDIIFFGFPVHSHSVPAKAEALLKNIPAGKKIALFATHGSLRGGEFAITAFYYALSLVRESNVMGTFACRGRVKPSMIEMLMQKPDHRVWAQEAHGASGHPHDADLEDGKEWARSMIRKAFFH